MVQSSVERNASRRNRYRADAAFRAKVAQQNHESYLRRKDDAVAYVKVWKKANPEKVAKSRAAYHQRSRANGKYREGHIRRRYGITPEQEQALWAAQEGRCAICKRQVSGPGQKDTHLDHDHTTKRVRGFLCIRCNHGIGSFLDDPLLLTAALEYLNRP